MRGRRRALLFLLVALVTPSVTSAGAWSHESFENDGALDWAAEFQQNPTAEFVRRTLASGANSRHIESFVGESIIAAAEVVAASLGRPCKGLPPEVVSLVARFGAQYRMLASLAQSALAGVLGSGSELRENWSLHADGLARWESSVNELVKRLSRPAA